MINHDVKWFDVSVHDAVRMCVLKCLQNFEGVKANVHSIELVIELLGLDVGNVLKHKAWRLGRLVPQDIVEFDDVGSSVECLQNFGFPVDFLGPDRLENLDDTWLIIVDINALEHF